MSDITTAALPPKVKLTHEQNTAIEIARIGFMHACPFFCYYFYAEMEEYPTLAIPAAATDGRRLFYNPEYLSSLKPSERVFVFAHEVYHVISKHPARMRHYGSAGNLRGHDWSADLFNICADFIINADLVLQSIGTCNPSWLYDQTIRPDELVEDVYEKLIKKFPPPPPQGGGQGQGQGSGQGQNQTQGASGSGQHPTYGHGSRGRATGKPDKTAQANGGRFDNVLPPRVDPVTGREDAPREHEFQEAVARAAAAAKAVGKLPSSFKRLVDEILEPQVEWREHIRMLVTGKIGARHETWDRLNRRNLALGAVSSRGSWIVTPGRRGYGANTVVVPVDTSGSIGGKELSAFFAEIGGILADVRPKTILVIWCDAKVHRVDEVSSLAELDHLRIMGAVGGGGTDFRPPFEYITENHIRPEAMIYLTDMYGPFPQEAPGYPVIWCSTSKGQQAPFGDVVEISV